MSSTSAASKTPVSKVKEQIGPSPSISPSNGPKLEKPFANEAVKALKAISVVKANTSLTNGNQHPHIAPDASQSTKEQMDLPTFSGRPNLKLSYESRTPDSVGPSYRSLPAIDKDFLRIVQTERRPLVRISGITGGRNHCYRNAVLTAFLSSNVVWNYLLKWHCQRKNGEVTDDNSFVLRKLSAITVALFLANIGQDKVNDTVNQFWQHFCYQKNDKGALLAMPPQHSWREHLQDVRGKEETQEQDAHEFLSWLLATMPRQFMYGTPGWKSNDALVRFEWVFKGRLITRITCGECQYQVRRRTGTSSESSLMLRIPDSEGVLAGFRPSEALSDLVRDSFQQELSMKCRRCKKTSQCVQERKLRHAPALLVLNIARGKVIPGTMQHVKDCTAVVIPELLDMSQHLNAHEFGEGSKVTYSLRGVVSHSGNQLDTGHYVSYIRRGKNRNDWHEMNDSQVQQVSQAYFDDSAVDALSKDLYVNRFTPYVLFYERNFDSDVLVPGREAFNVDEGDSNDEQPSHWTGRERCSTPDAALSGSNAGNMDKSGHPDNSDDENKNEGEKGAKKQDNAVAWITGAKGEEKALPAALLVKVTIGEVEVKLPRQLISHLDWKQSKDVKIDVKLRAPKGLVIPTEKDHIEASLSDMQNQAYHSQQRQQEKQNSSSPGPGPPVWGRYWKSVKRSADDVTEGEIQDAKRYCRTQQSP